MLKKYKLSTPKNECFICGGKIGMSFELESLKFIQTLTLCDHHKQTTENAIKNFSLKTEVDLREPGCEG